MTNALQQAGSSADLERYRSIYSFADDAELDVELVRSHWSLERSLASDILNSSPAERAAVAERAYTTLYEELHWHNELPRDPEDPRDWTDWHRIIGDEPLDIYEIGSGQAELLRELSALGHRCTGTEITTERGGRYDEDGVLTWASTDGVHLDRFAEPGSFDLVISNQVIEHLHPDDLAAHLSTALTLLRPGGRYVLSVPHRLTGPHDVSEAFGNDHAIAMHLKEYSWAELRSAMASAGFDPVGAVSLVRVEPLLSRIGLGPRRSRRALGAAYLRAMLVLEAGLFRISDRSRQQELSRRLKARRVFADNIFLVGQRPD